MEFYKKLLHENGYIDGITIINQAEEILFTAKLNEKLLNKKNASEWVGKRLTDIFENLSPNNSTMLKALTYGIPFYVANQRLKTKEHEATYITSLSIPIKAGGKVVGVIDLSVAENSQGGEECPEWLGEDQSAFLNDDSKKLVRWSNARFTEDDIIAVDESMKRAKAYIPIVASCELPVMIYGETGTGKEVFAQAIHNASSRREKPFIAQNCAALPETLLESILFGTSKGAFTGATDNRGLFELADGGTLFLDEINSMPLFLQSKLLRVLQDGSFRSLGSKELKRVNVKLISALNTEPMEAVQKGQIRRDIYYRLSMMSITIPPLRERKKDIAYFVKFYINKHNATFGKKVQYVSKELLAHLEEYDWPGNVRELEHVIVYGMSMVNENSSRLNYEDIADKFQELEQVARVESKKEEAEPMLGTSLRKAVDEFERDMIERTLRTTGGNISEAARILDVPRQTLQRKVREYGLKPL